MGRGGKGGKTGRGGGREGGEGKGGHPNILLHLQFQFSRNMPARIDRVYDFLLVIHEPVLYCFQDIARYCLIITIIPIPCISKTPLMGSS